MIRSLQTRTTAQTGTKPAHAPVKTRTATADFQKLLTPAATQSTTLTTPKPSAEVPHLGPFTGDPFMHPAAEPIKAPDPITSSPYLPAGYPGDTDLMNKAQHETTMNDWLQNYTKWSNDNKMQIHQQAMANWQLNDQRCRELGIEAPPKPTPPTLDPIQPMPAGYWFKS
jgi:hypothetical protein